jgi:hypothetical protein
MIALYLIIFQSIKRLRPLCESTDGLVPLVLAKQPIGLTVTWRKIEFESNI